MVIFVVELFIASMYLMVFVIVFKKIMALVFNLLRTSELTCEFEPFFSVCVVVLSHRDFIDQLICPNRAQPA